MATIASASIPETGKRRRFVSGERLLMASGFVLATVSGLFAAHSISINTGQPRHFVPILPSGQLMAWKKGVEGSQFQPREIDVLTTGSISRSPVAGDQSVRSAGSPPAERRVLQTYTLRGVVDGAAVIESADGIRQVRLGAVVPGAGRISAIEQIGGDWVVMTSQGVIREER